jgi:hypothetical protein
LFSPFFIKRELFPSVKKILNRLKEKGYKVIYDFEGDNREALDIMVKDGADAFTPVEEISGVDIEEIKKKYPRLVLGFMIDSIDLLTNGSSDDVIKKARDIVRIARDHGGILIGSSGALHNEVPV